MLLDFDILKKITFGAVEADDSDGFVSFKRMNDKQISAYCNENDDLHLKIAHSTASVRMSFQTDSDFINMDFVTVSGSSRDFMGIDIYENGILTGHFSDDVGKEGHITHFFTSGEKDVELYFPWSCSLLLKRVEIQDGCKIIPIKRRYTLYAFGDSITQGYDAQFPSLTYINIFSRKINADVNNFAVAGDIYQTKLLDKTELPAPDIITVASGTNDWNILAIDYFIENCAAFYKIIQTKYPDTPIYVITPVWRRDTSDFRRIGISFLDVGERIRQICSKYKNVKVIDGYNLVNHSSDFFADKRLHPNDLGFMVYADRLYEKYNALK